MDRRGGFANYEPSPRFKDANSTAATTVAAGVLILYLAYLALGTLEIRDWFWNAFVTLIPARILLDSATLRSQSTQDGDMYAHRHAAKSEVLRKLFGTQGQALQTAIGVAQRARSLSTSGLGLSQIASSTSELPPGLGNWDNSCYQNSVLQGLAALPSIKTYLDRFVFGTVGNDNTTATVLRATIEKLNDPNNHGRHLWTPAKLKSMSSWQQQDAQEYFSKIMDELDKEASRAQFPDAGLENAVKNREVRDVTVHSQGNPLEGLLAQRVACTRCGFSEGISMIPFNCLTVPLGSAFQYDLEFCLNEYTGLEEIGEVECAKCTLLNAEQQLRLLVHGPKPLNETDVDSIVSNVPAEVRDQAAKRLEAVQKALEEEDFSDKTISQACQISKKAHASSTKTRQAVIGRAPQSLAIHVNRSMFDERTGAQRKNYANVRFPSTLDLSPWVLGHERNENEKNTRPDAIALASRSMLLRSTPQSRVIYRLRAVVTHFGRHENGHYIAYKQHPVISSITKDETKIKCQWWRLSDEDVSAVTDEEMLDQGGVFMLFYDRELTESLVQAIPNTTNVTADLTNMKKADAAPQRTEVSPEPLTSGIDESLEERVRGIVRAAVPPTEAATIPSQSPTNDPVKTTARRQNERKHNPPARREKFNVPMRPMVTI